MTHLLHGGHDRRGAESPLVFGEWIVAEPIAEVGYLAGNCQYDGSAWVKSNLLWGYHDRWFENLGGTFVEDTIYIKASTAVPEGYVYVMQMCTVRNVTRAPTTMSISVGYDDNWWYLEYDTTPAKLIPLISRTTMCLKEGDKARVAVAGCVADDVIEACVWGYKMMV